MALRDPRAPHLAALCGASILLPSAFAQAQAPKAIADAAEEQFRTCVSLPSPASAGANEIGVSVPPGLARGAAVTITQVPTDRGRLYAYRDHGGREIICGIAVYGVDPKPIAERLGRVIASSPIHLSPHSAAYTLSSAMPGDVSYFGHGPAPGLEGVLIFERPVADDSPSLEADFHVVLIP